MKIHLKPIFIASLIFTATPLQAQNCNFEYWSVIPQSSSCALMHLPDFEFAKLPADKNSPDYIKKFCKRYAVKSKAGYQETSYCYTGEGDASGPTFEIEGKKFLADLNFVGCLNGKMTQGVVFVPGDWTIAPKNLQRLWPVDSLPKKVDCIN